MLRARIVLLAAEGVPNSSIAARLGCSQPTVRLWRERFSAAGIAGLEEDAPGRGRPALYDERTTAQVLSVTLGRPPKGETHWSSRAVAERVGISPGTVLRIWHEHQLQPQRTRSFKASTDPELEAKVTDVIGLYLHPPEKAVVLCVDEKVQIQALDRTQPLLPMRPGQPERRSHKYVRHGTATLFAALDIASGEVTGRTYARHRHQEFLKFLQLVANRYPHQGPGAPGARQLPHPQAPRGQRLVDPPPALPAPTHAHQCRLNDRRILNVVLDRAPAIRRGVFRSVGHLKDAIQRFLDAWNRHCHPFAWVKTADEVLGRTNAKAISGAVH